MRTTVELRGTYVTNNYSIISIDILILYYWSIVFFLLFFIVFSLLTMLCYHHIIDELIYSVLSPSVISITLVGQTKVRRYYYAVQFTSVDNKMLKCLTNHKILKYIVKFSLLHELINY